MRVTDPNLRFFLALLLNIPDRDTIFRLVRQRHPGTNPRTRVVSWLEKLSGVDLIGVDLGEATTRALVLALLDGCGGDRLFARLAEEFDPASVRANRRAIAQHCERLRRTALAPLFTVKK